MKPDDMLDLSLLATSGLYAAWLRRHKELEPHRTWLEVAFGVGYTLAYTSIALRFQPRAPGGVEWRFWRSVVVASIPIVAGEIEQEVRARAEYAAYKARAQEFYE